MFNLNVTHWIFRLILKQIQNISDKSKTSLHYGKSFEFLKELNKLLHLHYFILVIVCVLVFRPLVYTVSALLPVAYIIGLIFTLKTHSHIYDIHVGEGQGMSLCTLLLYLSLLQ